MAFQRDIDKGKGEIIRVEISEFRDQKFFNIRIWYTDKDSGEYKPTQRGVTIQPHLFAQLKQAFLEAEPEIERLVQNQAEPEVH